jgi:hypothetical protein
MDLLARLHKESEEENVVAMALVDAWERARHDPNVRLALLRQQDVEQQLQMAVSVAKTATREAALKAMREEQLAASQMAKGAVLQLADARAMAVAQLRRCQDTLEQTMDSYLKDVDRSRKERGMFLAEDERREMMLGKEGPAYCPGAL